VVVDVEAEVEVEGGSVAQRVAMRVKKSRFESEQRAGILNAAVRVFGEKGYKGATIRSLGRAAKVNSSLLYYYYENKHNLFTESIRMILRGFLDSLAARRQKFAGAHARLSYLVDAVFDYYLEHPDRMRLMALTLTLHTKLFAEALNTFVEGEAAIPLAVLQEGMDHGELRRMHPVHAWWSIMGMCMFNLLARDLPLEIRLKATPLPPFSPADRKQQIVEILVQGLAQQTKRSNAS
jgi:AcrR family transcriptional regulator